jgi:glyoxylase-like metal-dependent hydrolase (beta-lactamase superfamily II)
MKSLHRPDLYAWSRFDEERNVDFNSVLWTRSGGNVVIDPLPLSDHDARHLEDLGGAAIIVVTNSDHVRSTQKIRERHPKTIVVGPAGESSGFPIPVDRFVSDGEAIVPGLVARALEGSKTPGELALVLEETTLITGDLVRAHRAGHLMLLPDAKLADRPRAIASVRRLLEHGRIEAVLVGDGWHLFSGGHAELARLAG